MLLVVGREWDERILVGGPVSAEPEITSGGSEFRDQKWSLDRSTAS
jgi:hypothetical protein